MSYEIGSYVDLSHINKPKQTSLKKNSPKEQAEHLFDVGTQFINVAGAQVKMALRIPVAMA